MSDSITAERKTPIDILDYLHLRYYSSNEYSDHTSSHWKQFGDLQRLEKVDGEYRLSGGVWRICPGFYPLQGSQYPNLDLPS